MIHILSDHVVNQIAAGEVIERPASVVRELLDNALDAGARTIEVELLGGGKQLVAVRDDGHGLAADMLPLALARHATSKLASVSDLVGLTTLGFRGEALASIASVARVRLRSRPAGADAAEIRAQGGQIMPVTTCPGPLGTLVEVRDLLFNVPARRKFLRSDGAELGHILDIVQRIAAAHPQVAFRVAQAGRTLLDLPAVATRDARLAMLWPEAAGTPVVGQATVGVLTATVHLAGAIQPTAKWVWLYADMRPVRDRSILHAVAMGLGEALAPRQYPVACVVVEAPASTVDINVHPQKQEVRFADPSSVLAAVRAAVRAAVARRGDVKPMLVEPPATRVATRLAQMAAPPLPAGIRWDHRVTAPPSAIVAGPERASSPAGPSDLTQAEAKAKATLPPSASRTRATVASESVAEAITARWGSAATGLPPASVAFAFRDRYFASLRYVGQLMDTYLVCEGRGELVLIDQARASQCVTAAATPLSRQPLLLPQPLTLSAAELSLVRAHVSLLQRLGYCCIDDAAGAGIMVTEIPVLRARDAIDVLAVVIAQLGHGAARAEAAFWAECALAPGEPLAEADALALLGALDQCAVPADVVVRVRAGDLAKLFGPATVGALGSA